MKFIKSLNSNKILAIFSQIIIIFIGFGVFAFMIWEPLHEGCNVNAAFFEIYFEDPFLAYVYVGSIPFFVGLYQIFKLLKYISQKELCLKHSAQALHNIKYCAFITAGLIMIAEVYLRISSVDKNGIEDTNALGIFAILFFIITGGIVAIFEKNLQKIKS